MADDVKFPDGMIVKKPHANAPDFVKAKVSIKRAELIAWLQGQEGEWINLDMKESKKGGLYLAVDDWKPTAGAGGSTDQSADLKPVDDDLPF